jgi:hypothetical protein
VEFDPIDVECCIGDTQQMPLVGIELPW